MTADGSDPARDEVARELLKHRSNLFAFILSLVRDFAFAEKVMREVAAAVCGQWADFRPGTSFRAWAARIARDRILALGREIPLSPEAIQGIERAAEAEPAASRLEAVRLCLEGAGGKTRSILAMRYRDGMSGAEIARRTKSTVGAVHTALSRARMALARCVEGRRAAEKG